jgi:hypothetical protein
MKRDTTTTLARLLVTAALGMVPCWVLAQQLIQVVAAPVAAPGATKAAAKPDEPTTVKLHLRPAAESPIALKYQLLPRAMDRKPGNAAIQYSKAIMLLADQRANDKSQKISDWLEVPLAQLPREEVKTTLGTCHSVLSQVELGARREHCDWEVPIREQTFFAILLPELSKLRDIARIVALQARLEIVEGRLDDAIRTFQTGYALARHASQGQTLIHGLIGIAIADMMSAGVRELIAEPGSPNLYWTLTMLPRPLVDMRPGMEMEMYGAYLSLPGLRDIDEHRHDAAYWQHWLDTFETTGSQIWGGVPPKLGWRAPLTLLALKGYPQARQALIAEGRSPDEVDAMPVPEVVVIYTLRTYDELRDRMFKWMFVPYPQARAGLEEADRYLVNVGRDREIVPLASLLLPAVSSVNMASARSERSIAVLRTVEAIRIYGAAHEARLPERLSDIKEVPVPDDPITGRPFIYTKTGDTAVLESPAPPGRPANTYAVRWEIEFERKAK